MNKFVHQKPEAQHADLTHMGKLYTSKQCRDLLTTLIDKVNWSEDSYQVYGRRFTIPRLQAWFADPGIRYSYSNNLLVTQAWIEPLLSIKKDIEQATEQRFNAVLLTYYRDGMDHVGWHADDEKELGDNPVIASLSLGETRQFQIRHKTEKTSDAIILNDGDLLLMHPKFQHNWLHCVPVEKSIEKPRINLTFRTVKKPSTTE